MGIDDRQMSAGRHLHQAQIGPIAVFRHELGIEGNRAGAGDNLAKVEQMPVGGDVFVMHQSMNKSLK